MSSEPHPPSGAATVVELVRMSRGRSVQENLLASAIALLLTVLSALATLAWKKLDEWNESIQLRDEIAVRMFDERRDLLRRFADDMPKAIQILKELMPLTLWLDAHARERATAEWIDGRSYREMALRREALSDAWTQLRQPESLCAELHAWYGLPADPTRGSLGIGAALVPPPHPDRLELRPARGARIARNSQVLLLLIHLLYQVSADPLVAQRQAKELDGALRSLLLDEDGGATNRVFALKRTGTDQLLTEMAAAEPSRASECADRLVDALADTCDTAIEQIVRDLSADLLVSPVHHLGREKSSY